MAGRNQVDGDLTSFSIFDITQSLMQGRKTARVTVSSARRQAEIYFAEGQIVRATDDAGTAGEDAAFEAFTWRTGTFAIDFDAPTAPRNIRASTDWLLLEVARRLDEASRSQAAPSADAAPAAAPADPRAPAKPVDAATRLKQELSAAFLNAASKAAPVAARGSRATFDGPLQTLLARHGSCLFLRGGLAPRIKTLEGFVTLGDLATPVRELDGFLDDALSETERRELRENKEVGVWFDAGDLGPFRVTAVDDGGSALVTFVPAQSAPPSLDTFGLGQQGDLLTAIADGLVVVAGPLSSGKSTLLAALVRHHLEERDRCVVTFTAGQQQVFAATRGFVVRRPMPGTPAAFSAAMRSAIGQGADVLAIDPVPDRDALQMAVCAARTGRLVLVTLDSLSQAETLNRLAQLTADTGGDRGGGMLADTLRAVVDLPARRTGETPAPQVLTIGREEQAALLNHDFAALRQSRAIVRNTAT